MGDLHFKFLRMGIPFVGNLSDAALALFTTIVIVAIVYLIMTTPQMLAAVKDMDAGGLKNSLIASGTIGMILAAIAVICGGLISIEWSNRGLDRVLPAFGKIPSMIMDTARMGSASSQPLTSRLDRDNGLIDDTS